MEETPKKLRDVIVETYKVQHNTVQGPENDQELWRLKEQVLICERELLRVLGFDLSVEHAYRPLLAYVKSISGPRDLAQIAWNFINDSLRTTVCLQYAPRCLAAASAFMASQYLELKMQRPFPLPHHPKGTSGKWFNAFQVRESTVRAIVSQIQQMYDDNKGSGGNGEVVGLANSAAIEKMRMHASSMGGPKGAPGATSGESAAGGGGGKSGGGDSRSSAVKREAPSASGSSSGVREGASTVVKREDGELEEGEVGADTLPPSKRAREGGP